MFGPISHDNVLKVILSRVLRLIMLMLVIKIVKVQMQIE
jgi:hypothetical protein